MLLVKLICLIRMIDIRKPIPTKDIKHIQSLCIEKDDDLRWLIALLSDSGMRLGEGVGLLKSDINLDCEIPHINLFLILGDV